MRDNTEFISDLRHDLIKLKTKIENIKICSNQEKVMSDRFQYICNIYYVYVKLCKFIDDIDMEVCDLKIMGMNLVELMRKSIHSVFWFVESVHRLIKNEESKFEQNCEKITFSEYSQKYKQYMDTLVKYKDLELETGSVFYFLNFSQSDRNV